MFKEFGHGHTSDTHVRSSPLSSWMSSANPKDLQTDCSRTLILIISFELWMTLHQNSIIFLIGSYSFLFSCLGNWTMHKYCVIYSIIQWKHRICLGFITDVSYRSCKDYIILLSKREEPPDCIKVFNLKSSSVVLSILGQDYNPK